VDYYITPHLNPEEDRMRLSSLFARPILVAIFVIGLGPAVSAQNWQGGIGFQVGLPTGEYKDQVDQTGVGIGGDFLWSPHGAPFGIGLSVNWFQIGHESREEPFSTTIPDVTVDVETENDLAQFMLLMRFQPKKGDLIPYAEGLVGLNYLYTQTTIKNASNNEDVASSTNLDDHAFAYGLGGGALIKVYDGKKKKNARPVQVFIDLNFRYTLGGEADYLKEGSIRREDGQVEYDVSQSKTNIAIIRLGVTAAF
jgi:hypothetical protein